MVYFTTVSSIHSVNVNRHIFYKLYKLYCIFVDGDWSIQVSSLETLENADVAIVVYGDKGNSGPIILGAPPGKSIFVAGNNDEFRVCIFVKAAVSLVSLKWTTSLYHCRIKNTKQM